MNSSPLLKIRLSLVLFSPVKGRVLLENELLEEGMSPIILSRGIYEIKSYCLILEDRTGWFRKIQLRLRSSGASLLVFPGESVSKPVIPSARLHVPERHSLNSIYKNQDFSENRPYIPGDDPRRIHWKMLARHEELIVREGSSMTPSRDEALVIANIPPRISKTIRGDKRFFEEGDELLRNLYSLIRELLLRGIKVSALLPGVGYIGNIGERSPQGIEDLLASLPASEFPDPRAFDIALPGILYLFTCRNASVKELTPDLSRPQLRKIMILRACSESERPGYIKEGWHIVEA